MSVEDLHLNLRNLQESDYPQLKRLMDGIYDDIGGAWPEHTINRLITATKRNRFIQGGWRLAMFISAR